VTRTACRLAFALGLVALPVRGLAQAAVTDPGVSVEIAQLTSPEEFFGFQMGTDRKIARWDKIVEYLMLLEEQSDRITVINMGPSMEGNPFLLVTVSSPENLANLEHFKEVNAKISDPRGILKTEIEDLIAEGKAVICQSMSLHQDEIGGTQMSPELIYDLAARDDEETLRILENVISLMIPCFNPDGQITVTDWYNKWLGTEYEGSPLPWLGSSRASADALMTNMIESQYIAKVLYQDWHPQAHADHHHFGSYGARLFIPPYSEPIRPYADPLIFRELSWYGAYMATKLEAAGKPGILSGAQFPFWGGFNFHWIGNFHNIASILTESANANLATPIYVHYSQLTSRRHSTLRGFPHYRPQTNFPNPWPGGWWTLRDIVDQQKIAAWALLDMAARNKDDILRNAYLKAQRQTERGAEGTPQAYVINPFQHDPLTVGKLIDKLLVQGVEITRATEELTAGEMTYPKDSYVVFLSQPKMGLIKNLLGRTLYPDDVWSRESDGTPLTPYEAATDTIAEFMGVRVDSIEGRLNGSVEVITEYETPRGRIVGMSEIGYIFDGTLNDSFTARNILLRKGVTILRIDQSIEIAEAFFAAGSFVASAGSEDLLKEIAREYGIDFYALENELEVEFHKTERSRVAMYQRYYGGNADEGWTRFLLKEFAFPHNTIKDAEIRNGNLAEKYDIIILPDDTSALITGENLGARAGRIIDRWSPLWKYPPEYRSGIGKEGVESIRRFVEAGGTLVAFNEACQFAIETLRLGVYNVLEKLNPKEFFCPGSTLRARIDNSHALGYGMPKEGLILFWNSQAFSIVSSQSAEDYEVIVKYPENDILESGWLVGEENLAGRAAMISAKRGKGKAILIGFKVQERARTHGTFKLLFNSLLQ